MRSSVLYITYVFILLFFQSYAHGFGAESIQIGPSPEENSEALFQKNPFIVKDNIGFILYDLENKKVVSEHNRHRVFIPASTTKIMTVAAALYLLGPDHTFKTTLSKSGSTDKGILRGNLYLKGGGDPNLTMNNLLQMIRSMKKKGIRKVEGEFYFDNTLYRETKEIENIMDDDAAYNTGISALSLETNTLFAFWKKPYRGSMQYFLVPSLAMNEVRSKQYKKDENSESEYIGDENKEIWMISPKNPNLGIKFLPVKNPSLYTAMVFRKLAAIQGIEIPEPREGKTPWISGEIEQIESQPLLDISRTILATSNNTMTENLLLNLAAEQGIPNPGMETASRFISKILHSQPGDVDWNGFYLENGSGLTSKNRISPEQMLAGILFSEQLKDVNFEDLLPISGWSSILRARLNDPETAFRVHAKNGGIYYAASLAGYLYAKSGKKYAFAFLITDYNARTLYEKEKNKRSKAVLAKIFGWKQTNQDFMDAVIQSWIETY